MKHLKLKHKKLQAWVKKMAEMCRPDKIVLIDGSSLQKSRLEKEAFSTGEVIRLNPKKLPGCIYHRTAPNDVARTENLTFICTKKKKNVWRVAGLFLVFHRRIYCLS